MRIANMALKGVPDDEISDLLNIPITTVNNVSKTFKRLLVDLDKVNDFRELRRDILDAGHGLLLESVLDPEKIADANLRDIGWVAESIYKQARLEGGLSTDNKSIRQFTSLNQPAPKK